MADGNITVTVNARADEVQTLVHDIERLRTALSELVALHDICSTLPAWPMSPDPDKDKRADFDRRHPLAWVAARTALGLECKR